MLFFKECKKVVRSLTFWIYCVLVFLMFFGNYYQDAAYRETNSAADRYKIVEDQELIMDGAINCLMGEFASNRYVCYPYGFIKQVKLKDADNEKVEKYIQELTHTDHNGVMELLEEGTKASVLYGLNEYPEYHFDTMYVDKSVSYDRFKEIMGGIDDILGGGSNYEVDSLALNYSQVPMTAEEAAKEYDEFISKDKVTGALARLYSDYTGIDLAILPVFVAAALVAADRRRRMTELVYSRKISSARLVFTRYTALVATMSVPVLITMVIALVQALNVYGDERLDMTAMFTLPTFWLLPEIMIVTAVGMLLTELFSAGVAIAVQWIWGFMSLMKGGPALSGNIGKFDLICRHNTLGHRREFLMNYDNFVFNRLFFIILSLVIAVITAYVYNLKRGGRFNGIRLFGKGGLLRRKA